MQSFNTQLPDQLFAPLAGPNRLIYHRVLAHLHDLFFEDHDADKFPPTAQVKSYIQDALNELSDIDWRGEEGGAHALQHNPPQLATLIFNRLCATGWLEREKDGYDWRVAMPPAVGHLLSCLMELSNPNQVYYGGMVLSIHNNLRAARDNPRHFSLGVQQARVDARRFSEHVASMAYHLANLLEKIGDLSDAKALLGQFFDDFVSRILVADYKRLKTRNNPFQFRQDILRLIDEMTGDGTLCEELALGYMRDQGFPDHQQAMLQLEKDLGLIRSVFLNVDRHLDRVEKHRIRYERRAAEAIRYQDRTQPGMAARLARLVEGMAAVEEAEFEAHFQTASIASARPLAEPGLYVAPAPRVPPPPQSLRRREIGADVLAREQAIRNYLNRTHLDPRRIEAYLDRCLAGAEEMTCETLPVESAEDYIAFAHVRFLPYFGALGQRIAGKYDIRVEDREAVTEWGRMPWFAVRRKEAKTETKTEAETAARGAAKRSASNETSQERNNYVA